MSENIIKQINSTLDKEVDHINKKIPPNVVIFNGHFCKDAVKIAFSSSKNKPTCNCHEYSQEKRNVSYLYPS